jgi:hypothetical protein
MLKSKDMQWSIHESWPKAVFLSAGIIALFVMGLLPSVFLPGMINLLQAFGRLY